MASGGGYSKFSQQRLTIPVESGLKLEAEPTKDAPPHKSSRSCAVDQRTPRGHACITVFSMQVAQSYRLSLFSKQSTKTSQRVNSVALFTPQYELVRSTPGSDWECVGCGQERSASVERDRGGPGGAITIQENTPVPNTPVPALGGREKQKQLIY